jgi:hypothetical protein
MCFNYVAMYLLSLIMTHMDYIYQLIKKYFPQASWLNNRQLIALIKGLLVFVNVLAQLS